MTDKKDKNIIIGDYDKYGIEISINKNTISIPIILFVVIIILLILK